MHSSPSSAVSRLTSHAALIIFTKAPIPGQVKTRLCPPLTPDEAAGLHGSFVLDALERSHAAATAARVALDRFMACAPSREHVFFKVLEERHGVRLLDQIGDDLGARMAQAFTAVFALGYRKVLLVGTDLPSLPGSFYIQALHLLADHDLVLGPSPDGGYYVIGLTQPAPDLFVGIPWSTDQVFTLTRSKAEALRLKTALLPAWRDVDTLDDLLALIQDAGLRTEDSGPRKKAQSSALTPQSSLSARTAGVLRLLADRLPSRPNATETGLPGFNH